MYVYMYIHIYIYIYIYIHIKLRLEVSDRRELSRILAELGIRVGACPGCVNNNHNSGITITIV